MKITVLDLMLSANENKKMLQMKRKFEVLSMFTAHLQVLHFSLSHPNINRASRNPEYCPTQTNMDFFSMATIIERYSQYQVHFSCHFYKL